MCHLILNPRPPPAVPSRSSLAVCHTHSALTLIHSLNIRGSIESVMGSKKRHIWLEKENYSSNSKYLYPTKQCSETFNFFAYIIWFKLHPYRNIQLLFNLRDKKTDTEKLHNITKVTQNVYNNTELRIPQTPLAGNKDRGKTRDGKEESKQ